jgi:exopolyphosphatase/pppGpp-phosphohydrolase
MVDLTDKQKAKLKEHSKMHKGGMNSKHMRNMVKFMKEGDSFTKAHNKAMKEDKKKPKKK